VKGRKEIAADPRSRARFFRSHFGGCATVWGKIADLSRREIQR
jgi:hypothetical protein